MNLYDQPETISALSAARNNQPLRDEILRQTEEYLAAGNCIHEVGNTLAVDVCMTHTGKKSRITNKKLLELRSGYTRDGVTKKEVYEKMAKKTGLAPSTIRKRLAKLAGDPSALHH